MKSKIVIPFTLFIFLISGYTFAQDLINAVKSGDINAVRELLPYSNMEEKDDDAYTAYHWTAVLGRTDIADLLLQNGANPNALTTFAESKNMDTLNIIRSSSIADDMTSKDAAVIAAEEHNNDENLVNYYLSKGRMFLHLSTAVRCGNIFVTKQLLENGVDPNEEIIDAVGRHVLYEAVKIFLKYNGPEQMIDILLEGGADISTDLDLSIVSDPKADEELFSYLISKGAKLRPLSEDENTAGETSLLLYQPNARRHLKFFIDNGIDLTVQDEERGRTILHWAVDKDWKLSEIQQLIPKNCDDDCLNSYLNIRDENEKTACDIVNKKLKYAEGYSERFQEYLKQVQKIVCSDYISNVITKGIETFK